MIYLTDASRDNKTGVSSISFIDKESKKTNNFQSNEYKNIFEAELKGIKLCLVDAFKKYSNVVIFCDSKSAISYAKRNLFTEMKLNEKFRSVQFVWLPRDYLNEVDFLTKNIDNLDLNKELKMKSSEHQMKGNVLDVFLSSEDYDNIIKEHFKSMDNLKNIEFKSLILIELQKGLLINNRQEQINSKEFYNDLKYIINNYPKESKNGSKLQKLVEMLTLFKEKKC